MKEKYLKSNLLSSELSVHIRYLLYPHYDSNNTWPRGYKTFLCSTQLSI